MSILEAVQALALLERRMGSDRVEAELVATTPIRSSRLLPTAAAARALVESASRDLLVIGFELRDPEFRHLLLRRGSDGVRVTVIGDRHTGSARELLRDWPAGAGQLHALENVEDAGEVRARLHGKVIVADSRVALIGSANFTRGGFRHNFEFGLRISGRPVQDLLALVAELERTGWLVPASAVGSGPPADGKEAVSGV